VVTSDVGPRVIRFGFVGGQNLFKEFPEQLGGKGEDQFQLRGGHRVWKAPEDPVGNVGPRQCSGSDRGQTRRPGGARTGRASDKTQKEITVRMAPSGTEVEVVHRIANQSLFPLEFAAWAMSNDGAGRHGHHGLSAARKTSNQPRSHQSTG